MAPTQLLRHVLRVPNLAETAAFYVAHFGMTPQPGVTATRVDLTSPAPDAVTLRLMGPPAAQVVGNATPRTSANLDDDVYWKIGFMTADVDALRTRLMAAGVDVSEPRQFRDIGYLCHLTDPAGFTVELLQHRFVPPRAPAVSPAPPDPLLGLVTLRCRDPEQTLSFYRDTLGLTLLSRQHVEPHAFTLYFLADTAERPPHRDIDAVANREWLWQRPYPLLEFQHRWGTEDSPAKYRLQHDQPTGLVELVWTSAKVTAPEVHVDPDGVRVRLLPAHPRRA